MDYPSLFLLLQHYPCKLTEMPAGTIGKPGPKGTIERQQKRVLPFRPLGAVGWPCKWRGWAAGGTPGGGGPCPGLELPMRNQHHLCISAENKPPQGSQVAQTPLLSMGPISVSPKTGGPNCRRNPQQHDGVAQELFLQGETPCCCQPTLRSDRSCLVILPSEDALWHKLIIWLHAVHIGVTMWKS